MPFSSAYPDRALLLVLIPDSASTTDYRFVARTVEWNPDVDPNNYVFGPEVVIEGPGPETHGRFSLVVDTNDLAYLVVREGTTEGPMEFYSTSTAGEANFGLSIDITGDDVLSVALSIDTSTTPNRLYAFHIKKATPDIIGWQWAPVDTLEWSVEITVDDGSERYNFNFCSSALETSGASTEGMVMYTERTSGTVRFLRVVP